MTDEALARIAAALERMAPAPLAAPDFGAAQAFVWHVSPDRLDPVARVNRVEVGLPRILNVSASLQTISSRRCPLSRQPSWISVVQRVSY